jgi:predicted  nucleic acid-binding Zn-ribbon protein
MPHKCTKCGREYNDGSTEILKGCASCGGKKFLYVKQDQLNEDVLDEKSIDEIAVESNEEILEVVEPKKKREIEMYDRVETIRIVSPGSYELNLEKMAESDERIVSVGKEGSYIIDLMSMTKDEPKKKGRKR